jgi:hypothetical protein
LNFPEEEGNNFLLNAWNSAVCSASKPISPQRKEMLLLGKMIYSLLFRCESALKPSQAVACVEDAWRQEVN